MLIENFTPLSATIGGVLIGVATLLMLFNGRVAGISGILATCLSPQCNDAAWSATFVVGLILAPLTALLFGYSLPAPEIPASWIVIVIAGVLVGFGTRLGGGCTSDHGVCGVARLSVRSIVATGLFMATAILVVAVSRHVLGV